MRKEREDNFIKTLNSNTHVKQETKRNDKHK